MGRGKGTNLDSKKTKDILFKRNLGEKVVRPEDDPEIKTISLKAKVERAFEEKQDRETKLFQKLASNNDQKGEFFAATVFLEYLTGIETSSSDWREGTTSKIYRGNSEDYAKIKIKELDDLPLTYSYNDNAIFYYCQKTTDYEGMPTALKIEDLADLGKALIIHQDWMEEVKERLKNT